MPLCTFCKSLPGWLMPRFYDMFESKYPNYRLPRFWMHQPSWNALQTSAQTCEFCALIETESERERDTQAQESMNTALNDGPASPAIRFCAYAGGRLEIACHAPRKLARLTVALDDESIARAPEHLVNLLSSRIVNSRADSERSFEVIHRWLARCLVEHTRCAKWDSQYTGRSLPTRVLNVGTDESQDFISLYEPEDQDSEKYLALSHCWGKSLIITTTKKELNNRLRSIPLSDLPNTFRDAVKITRRLNIKYLWIDALCIIQDDYEDWRREAAQMHRVYSQALVTIAATASSDGNGGCFGARTARHAKLVRLAWDPHASELSNRPGWPAEPLNMFVVPQFRSFEEELQDSPLARRAWTFQERALAARMLHYGSGLTFWECKEACIGEDNEMEAFSAQDGFYNLKDMLVVEQRSPDISKLQQKWAFVIEEFSRRALTKGDDKLPALSGLARSFGYDALARFHCGLWEEGFHRHLLWHCNRFETPIPSRRSQTYRAPSWSWVSMDGLIENFALAERAQFDHTVLTYQTREMGGVTGGNVLLNITKVDVTTEGDDPFGKVSGGYVEATGVVKKALRSTMNRTQSELTGVHELDTVDGSYIGFGWWDEDLEQRGICVCPVIEYTQKSNGFVDFACLLLRLVDGKPRTYTRCGKARVRKLFFQDVQYDSLSIV